jgi:hypothetical protein
MKAPAREGGPGARFSGWAGILKKTTTGIPRRC